MRSKEEIVSKIFDNGHLKKGFELHLKSRSTGCVTGLSSKEYLFKLGFIYFKRHIGDFTKNILKESTLEQEFSFLYDMFENAKERDFQREKSTITITYNKKVVYQKEVFYQYDLTFLDNKLILYIDRDNYFPLNSKDISYIYNMAFTETGRLTEKYHLKVEYGMKTVAGISHFKVYTFTKNNSDNFNIARKINTLGRILRYQEDVYKEKADSLIFISISLYHMDTCLYQKSFNTFNTCLLDINGEKNARKILNFSNILNKLL